MSNAPSFLSKAPASPQQSQVGTIAKISMQTVTINSDTGRVEVPMAQLQVNGRSAQAEALKMNMKCLQEGGVWKVQTSEFSSIKPGFNSQMGPKPGPDVPPPISKAGLRPSIAQSGAQEIQPRQNAAIPQTGNMQQMPSLPSMIEKDSLRLAVTRPQLPSRVNLGVSYQVMKLENQQATIRIENSSRTIPFSCFYDPTQLKIGCSVRTDDGNNWTTCAFSLPAPRCLSKSADPSTYLIRTIKGDKVVAFEAGPIIEVPIASILTPDQVPVSKEMLEPYLRIQLISSGAYKLLDPPHTEVIAGPQSVPQLLFKQR